MVSFMRTSADTWYVILGYDTLLLATFWYDRYTNRDLFPILWYAKSILDSWQPVIVIFELL